MILRFLFYVFLIYLLYKLIFDFIVPVYKTTQRVKKGFREMSARMNHSDGHEKMQQNMNGSQQQQQNANKTKIDHSEDYIDFEELKD